MNSNFEFCASECYLKLAVADVFSFCWLFLVKVLDDDKKKCKLFFWSFEGIWGDEENLSLLDLDWDREGRNYREKSGLNDENMKF